MCSLCRWCPLLAVGYDYVRRCPGSRHQRWQVGTGGQVGGVLAMQSKLGAFIHRVATRAVKLWKAFDGMVFKLEKVSVKHASTLMARSLRSDYAKLWFAQKAGAVLKGLGGLMCQGGPSSRSPHVCRAPVPLDRHFCSVIGSAAWKSTSLVSTASQSSRYSRSGPPQARTHAVSTLENPACEVPIKQWLAIGLKMSVSVDNYIVSKYFVLCCAR